MLAKGAKALIDNRPLKGVDDTINILATKEIAMFFRRKCEAMVSKELRKAPPSDREIVDGKAYEGILKFHQGTTGAQESEVPTILDMLKRGEFDSEFDGKRGPTVHSMLDGVEKYCNGIIKNKISSYRKKRKRVDIDGQSYYVSETSWEAIEHSHESSSDLSVDVNRLRKLVVKSDKLKDVIHTARRIYVSFQMKLEPPQKDSARMRALFAWKFGDASTATEAAEREGVTRDMVTDMWENITKPSSGSCQVRRWFRRQCPHLGAQVDRLFKEKRQLDERIEQLKKRAR